MNHPGPEKGGKDRKKKIALVKSRAGMRKGQERMYWNLAGFVITEVVVVF